MSEGEPARGRVLRQVLELVCNDREATHGDPIHQHNCMAELMTTWLRHRYDPNIKLDAIDAMMFLDMAKTSRMACGQIFEEDHPRDKIGYGSLIYEAIDRKDEL